jgi:acyl-CoA synthetase (NDP forming)
LRYQLPSQSVVHRRRLAASQPLNSAQVEHASKRFPTISSALAAAGHAKAMDGVLVQPMIRGGVDVMVGVTQDPLFGPLIAFGLGGVMVEVLADVCFRIAPLTDRDAAEMLRAIRGWRLLQGFRGQPAADLEALQELLLRLARLVEEVPEIAEIDLNPVVALPSGCQVVDCRIQAR